MTFDSSAELTEYAKEHLNYDIDPASAKLLGNIHQILKTNDAMKSNTMGAKAMFATSMRTEQDDLVDNLLEHAENL